MLSNPTLETLRGLKLHGMAAAFEEQLQNPSTASLAFEERFGLLVDRERLHRENGRTTRLLRLARLKHSQASVEDINYRADRKLDKRLMATLATGEWIRRGQGLLMTGKTGTGKSWLFCALARQACRQGRSVRYWRLARLFEQLRIAHADGSYMDSVGRWVSKRQPPQLQHYASAAAKQFGAGERAPAACRNESSRRSTRRVTRFGGCSGSSAPRSCLP